MDQILTPTRQRSMTDLRVVLPIIRSEPCRHFSLSHNCAPNFTLRLLDPNRKACKGSCSGRIWEVLQGCAVFSVDTSKCNVHWPLWAIGFGFLRKLKNTSNSYYYLEINLFWVLAQSLRTAKGSMITPCPAMVRQAGLPYWEASP